MAIGPNPPSVEQVLEIAEDFGLELSAVPFRATRVPPSDCSLEETVESTHNMTVNTAVFDAAGHPSISVPVRFGVVRGTRRAAIRPR